MARPPGPKLSVPPVPPLLVVKTRPPAPLTWSSALTAIEWKAWSVSVVGALQATGAATVMSPAWAPGLPAPPVVTVTFAVASAVDRVVALMTESLPVAAKPVWFAFAPFEMVTL